MKIYTPDNPPKSGKGKRIWETLTDAGFDLVDLHYTPNLWGRGKTDGWGTWAFAEKWNKSMGWCGISDDKVYVQQMVAPYTMHFIVAPNDPPSEVRRS